MYVSAKLEILQDFKDFFSRRSHLLRAELQLIREKSHVPNGQVLPSWFILYS